jgi:hypothetical protein
MMGGGLRFRGCEVVRLWRMSRLEEEGEEGERCASPGGGRTVARQVRLYVVYLCNRCTTTQHTRTQHTHTRPAEDCQACHRRARLVRRACLRLQPAWLGGTAVRACALSQCCGGRSVMWSGSVPVTLTAETTWCARSAARCVLLHGERGDEQHGLPPDRPPSPPASKSAPQPVRSQLGAAARGRGQWPRHGGARAEVWLQLERTGPWSGFWPNVGARVCKRPAPSHRRVRSMQLAWPRARVAPLTCFCLTLCSCSAHFFCSSS